MCQSGSAGGTRDQSPILFDILHMHSSEAVRCSKHWEEGEICQSFCEGRNAENKRAREKKGGRLPVSLCRAEVQWRDTHPRGEEIFEVRLHQSMLAFIFLFNLSLSPPVITHVCLQLPHSEWREWYWRLCLPGATTDTHLKHAAFTQQHRASGVQ